MKKVNLVAVVDISLETLNNSNPFIRYKMTDVALNPRFEPCQECGRIIIPFLIA